MRTLTPVDLRNIGEAQRVTKLIRAGKLGKKPGRMLIPNLCTLIESLLQILARR